MTTPRDLIGGIEACEIFARAKLTISTLRAEAGRGHLDKFRLGKRDYTTVRSMREMLQRVYGKHSPDFQKRAANV
jgi:hypothetical protein